MATEKFLASCYWFSRLVDQRMINKNTVVAVINIYCNYLQQNGELNIGYTPTWRDSCYLDPEGKAQGMLNSMNPDK